MVFYHVLCISRVSMVVVFSVIPLVVGADSSYCSDGGCSLGISLIFRINNGRVYDKRIVHRCISTGQQQLEFNA